MLVPAMELRDWILATLWHVIEGQQCLFVVFAHAFVECFALKGNTVRILHLIHMFGIFVSALNYMFSAGRHQILSV